MTPYICNVLRRRQRGKKKNDAADKQIKIIHTIPRLSDIEKDKLGKQIGNDLYDIFVKIHAELKNESEFIKT